MTIRVGYLTPEFPGQTHTFVWRERQFLTQAGVETDMLSTRRPTKKIMSHSWAEDAAANTTYLFPLSLQDVVGTVGEWLRAGPAGWYRCLSCIVQAEGVSLAQRLRLLAIAAISGKLAWLARTRGWSHVHVHSCAEAAHVVMFASKLSGITYSLALFGPTLEQYGPNQRMKWKNAAFGLVISQLLYNHVHQVLAGSLPPRVEIATMAVDTETFQRTKPYVPWNGDRPFKLFSSGRLNPVKGHNFLIAAVELLRNQGHDVRLEIAGEDEQGGTGYHQVIEHLIQEKSLTEYVTLLGAISEEAMREGLESADTFALASLNEGISVAVMEAMALQLPVVVTRVGGMHELVDSGVDGILVEPEQVQELAEAIAKIMQDSQFAQGLSQKGRQKVAEKFDSRIGAQVLLNNLKIVTNQTGFTQTGQKLESFAEPEANPFSS